MNFFKTLTLTLAISGAAALISCEGPAGPAGPTGPKGDQGNPGNNTACTECHHDSTDVLARMIQYEESGHFANGNFARSDASCAPCHTSEGFVETLATGLQATAAKVNDPTPPGCRTCHRVHETFTRADFALRTTAPVALWASAGTTFDQGNNNLCARCHQARPSAAVPTTEAGTFKITSSRFGPHHSGQSQMLLGTLGVQFQNGTPYPGGNPHKNAGCITCHMATPYGSHSGGHQMGMAYDYHGAITRNVAGCVECHTTAEATSKWKATEEEILGLMDELKTLLIAKGVYDTTNDLAKTGDFPMNVAAAYWNYNVVNEDHSKGLHNVNYVRALLKNTIAEMKK